MADEPPLYGFYSRREVLLQLGAGMQVVEAWGGQLVILPERIGLLATLGPPETAPHFVAPNRFRFRPDQPYTPDDAEYGWMPTALGQHVRAGRKVHLFARQGAEDRYPSLGRLTLQMFTGPSDYHRQYIDFLLAPRLPRELWSRFGGYAGWHLSLNHQDYLLAERDVATLAALLDAMSGEESLHLLLTRYEGDSLLLRAEDGAAYLRYEDEEGGEWLSLNPAYPEDTEEMASFFCACGASLEMPLCYVLPRVQALEAVLTFVRTDALPQTMEWYTE